MTSSSKVIPYFAFTVLLTIYIKSKISLALAFPKFTTNPQCFSETCAPLSVSPLNPLSSINLAAKWPSGLLNVLPADGYSSGCLDSLFIS